MNIYRNELIKSDEGNPAPNYKPEYIGNGCTFCEAIVTSLTDGVANVKVNAYYRIADKSESSERWLFNFVITSYFKVTLPNDVFNLNDATTSVLFEEARKQLIIRFLDPSTAVLGYAVIISQSEIESTCS